MIADVEYVAALVEDAVYELSTRERRCTIAVGMPDATLRVISFPPMTALERERAARFEAGRYVDYCVDDAVVRLHPADQARHMWALGIVRMRTLKTRTAALSKAGLRVKRVDDEGCALRRAFPGHEAIVDVGHARTTLHLNRSLESFQIVSGGFDITHGIQDDLCVDERSAESRKRILGTAGAGERAKAALANGITSLISAAKAAHPVQRIAFVGNGARLPGLARDVEAATATLCENFASPVLRSGTYPSDVLGSNALDWTLAAALALGGE